MDQLPPKLYKYRHFGIPAIRAITDAEVYFARPNTFNDPLDGKPIVVADLGWREAEEVWRRVHEDGFFGLKPRAKSPQDLTRMLGEYRYNSTEEGGTFHDEGDGTQDYLSQICGSIQDVIYEDLAPHGVLALASKWDCPLMWSHYGDQHRGICIEFDTTQPPPPSYDVRRVRYDIPRTVPLSCIARWKLEGRATDKQAILDAYFLAKAPEWQYEDEYRVLSDRSGVHPTPFPVTGIYFGMRCDEAVKKTLIHLMTESGEIDFYSIYPVSNGFRLKAYGYDIDETLAFSGVRRAAWDYFKDMHQLSEDGETPSA